MMVRTTVLMVLAFSLLATAQEVMNPFRVRQYMEWVPVEIERARLVSQLERMPGQHLVFVHIRQDDLGGIFWIYNDPDLNKSKIIWAHDMGDAENRSLINLYPGRNLWFVDKDNAINALRPYSPETQLAGAVSGSNAKEAGGIHVP